jgi:hypothetical protein
MNKALVVLMVTLMVPVFADPPGMSDRDFPDSLFISAIGMGATAKEAEINALSQISYYFKTTVQAEEQLISQYNQVISGKHTEEFRRTEMGKHVKTSSEAEFRGVRFTDPWYNPETKTWTIRGYINKHEALENYQKRIDTNVTIVAYLVDMSSQQTELLYQYWYLKDAAAIARLIEADIRASADVAEPGAKAQFQEVLSFIRNIITEYNGFRSRITFDVQIDADSNGRVQRKLFQVLEKNKYVSDPDRGIYIIVGEIALSEEELPAGFFVRAGIELQMLNQDGTVLFSYSTNYPRHGSKNVTMAYNATFRDIEQDLEKNFIAGFNAFIGD